MAYASISSITASEILVCMAKKKIPVFTAKYQYLFHTCISSNINISIVACQLWEWEPLQDSGYRTYLYSYLYRTCVVPVTYWYFNIRELAPKLYFDVKPTWRWRDLDVTLTIAWRKLNFPPTFYYTTSLTVRVPPLPILSSPTTLSEERNR